MSVYPGGWALIAEAMANRQVDAIIALCVEEVDLQLLMLHALYQLWAAHQYEDVALILNVLQGEWV